MRGKAIAAGSLAAGFEKQFICVLEDRPVYANRISVRCRGAAAAAGRRAAGFGNTQTYCAIEMYSAVEKHALRTRIERSSPRRAAAPGGRLPSPRLIEKFNCD